MVRKIIKLPCVRCPINKPHPATRSETISIGESRWVLELCESCGRKLDMDLWSWGRLGREVEERGSLAAIRMFTEDSKFEARRAAELRSQQKDVVPTPPPAADEVDPTTSGPWRFTEHARERLHEVGISVQRALVAAARPADVRPASLRDGGLATLTDLTEVHEAEGVKVVVNLLTKEILNVAPAVENRKAI